MTGMRVARIIERTDGMPGVVQQHATVTEKDDKLVLVVHGMAAVGKDAKPRHYRSAEAVLKDGWTEVRTPA